jgi:hypothetical protein
MMMMMSIVEARWAIRAGRQRRRPTKGSTPAGGEGRAAASKSKRKNEACASLPTTVAQPSKIPGRAGQGRAGQSRGKEGTRAHYSFERSRNEVERGTSALESGHLAFPRY